jgi:hypothetical protein
MGRFLGRQGLDGRAEKQRYEAHAGYRLNENPSGRTMPRRRGLQPISSEPAPSHRPWASARARPLADLVASNPNGALPRQAVVAIGLHDRALLAGCRDGHLCGALGTFGERHDLLAELGITGLRSQVIQRLSYIVRLDLASVYWHWRRRRPGSREPQAGGIELEQARRLWGRIAKLKAEFDGVELRRRSRQQEIAVANRMQRSRGRRYRSRSGRWICARGGPRSTRLGKPRASATGSGTTRPWRGCRFHPDRAWNTVGPG